MLRAKVSNQKTMEKMLSATEDRGQQQEETKELCTGSPGMIKGCSK